MDQQKKNALLTAAVAGILSAGVLASAPASASMHAQMGKCVAANSCKGQSSCKTAKNDCAGKNGCAGQGFVKTTAQQCKVLKKSHPNARFVPMKAKKMEKKA